MAMPVGSEPASRSGPVNITMVTFNRVDFTRRSIAAVAETAGHPYELTVVDNASSDSTVDVLREYRAQGLVHRVILNTANRGVAFAANQGWAAGLKPHYMKLDNDIVFTKYGWLAQLVKACDALSGLGAIAYNFETDSYPPDERDGVRIRLKEGNLGGAAIMIPERAHRVVGFWCEDYWPYGEEDFDMYVRLSEAGLASYYMDDENVGLHLPEGKAAPLIGPAATAAFDEGDAEYRLQKDDWRAAHAGINGLRNINASLYRARLRPLYVAHNSPYRPSIRARIHVARAFHRIDRWERSAATPLKGGSQVGE
jgi:O-antigen biosynthesis protein